jgi:tetratricopeptide (TPR) repeat protein
MVFQLIVVGSAPLIAAIATLSYARRENPIVLWFATFCAAFLTLMGVWQSRWMLNTSGGMICLILVLIACWTGSFRPRVRWAIVLALLALMFGPNLVWRYLASKTDLEAKHVATKDAFGPLNRDIAYVLRASQPQGDITLLTSPNSSVGVSYFGRFKTLGTLYWENTAGLKSAASILAAKNEDEAAALIKAHGVTHVAIISEENFIQQYYQLLHPNASEDEIRRCFGWRILFDKAVPSWLQMIPYRIPDELRTLGVVVMLFKVNFQQSVAEAIYNVVLSQEAQDDLDGAEKNLEILLTQAPQLYQPWIEKGKIQLARHNWDAAIESTLKGLALAPPAERAALYPPQAQIYFNLRQHASAVRIYRAALAEKYDPDLASYLAWVLATSSDDSVRNGKEALAMAKALLEKNPNSPTYLNALAAALAETGRFPEAIDAADRALANARTQPQPPGALKMFEERLAILRSQKPLRN